MKAIPLNVQEVAQSKLPRDSPHGNALEPQRFLASLTAEPVLRVEGKEGHPDGRKRQGPIGLAKLDGWVVDGDPPAQPIDFWGMPVEIAPNNGYYAAA